MAERWVAQWGESGGVLVVEPRPRSGLVKELLFNRFSHQLHRLLGASTTVTKCSFTIKKSTSVVSSLPATSTSTDVPAAAAFSVRVNRKTPDSAEA